jgi:hypothetical protein
MTKLKLIGLAVLGTAMGYLIVTHLIQEMSFWQYLAIELCITLFHELYNTTKNTLNSQ